MAFNIADIGNFFTCLGILFQSIGTYITCAFQKITSLGTCLAPYYVISCLFFMFITLPIDIICWFLPQLEPIFNTIGHLFTSFDQTFYGFSKFYLFQWPDNVVTRCYTCNIIPFPDFGDLGHCGDSGNDDGNDDGDQVQYVKCS